MAIRPISIGLNSVNYNRPAFSGKSKEEHSNPISHKLAVPTAALIMAMTPSPNSARVADFDENVNEIEMFDELNSDGKVLEERVYNEKIGAGRFKETLRLISEDSNDYTVERVEVDIGRGNQSHHFDDVRSIVVVKIGAMKPEYWLLGSGQTKTRNSTYEFDNLFRKPINEDFINYLLDLANDKKRNKGAINIVTIDNSRDFNMLKEPQNFR